MHNLIRSGRRSRVGFTLVEMLVVIAIIAILLGLVFKLMGGATDRAAKAKTVSKIEKVKAALEEFYAEYGQYPPVPYYGGEQPFRYEYAIERGMRVGLTGRIKEKKWEEAPVFTFGLMAFLATRYQGRAVNSYETLRSDCDQWKGYNSEYNADLARDAAAVAKWWPFLDGITYTWPAARVISGESESAGSYTNLFISINDGWDHELKYRSPPPHQSYTVWSSGPTGSKKDDIEGHAGH